MYENCRDNKYFLINLDTEVRNNDSITKIWLCKVMSAPAMHITERHTLLSTIKNIDNNLLHFCEPVLIRTLLFGSNSFDANANINVLNATTECIISTKRFDNRVFQ